MPRNGIPETVMVAMRDGVHSVTDIYPPDGAGLSPATMERTLYSFRCRIFLNST
jgi:predicted acyl esterase